MARRARILTCLLTLLTAGAIAPRLAAADGLPLPFDSGDNVGVTNPETPYRYSAVAAGGETVALQIAKGTADIRTTARLRGEYGVPLVAYDGTASGLSADGERLILWNPRRTFPRETTEFALLDTSGMKVLERITLRGDYSFDALSPDGTTLYLIRYTDTRDPTAYEVRAYDLERRRLRPEPIVDEDVAPVTMGGLPQTRATSPDGRWEYTLYSSVRRHHPPFIHALDTKTGDAACINLDALMGFEQLQRLSLEPSPDGAVLAVVDRGEAVLEVDLATNEVSEPEAAAGGSSAAASEAAPGDSLPVLAVGAAALLLALGMLGVRYRRRDRAEDPSSDPTTAELAAVLEEHDVASRESDREREPIA
jgi:hypothetical protein